MTEKEVLDGLKILSSPDTRRLEEQEHEGRRIQKVEDGWFVLNGQKYEDLMRKLAERARKARWARRHRDQMRIARNGIPLPGEGAAVKESMAGNEEGAERIAAEYVRPAAGIPAVDPEEEGGGLA